jgi:hypothetical protein
MSLAHRLGLMMLAEMGGGVSPRQNAGFMSSTGNPVPSRPKPSQGNPRCRKKNSRKFPRKKR